MVNCCIVGCTKRSVRDRGIRFFRIPKVIENHCPRTKELSEKRRHLWLCRINRDDLKYKNMECLRVCCLHFIRGKPSNLFDHENLDWAPSLLLSNNKNIQVSTVKDDLHQSEDFTTNYAEKAIIDQSELTTHNTNVASKTEPTLEKHCHALQIYQIQSLHAMPMRFSEDVLKENDDKVQFYTGLPTFSILKTLYDFLHKELRIKINYVKHALTPFEEFLLVLMRLRLNMQLEELALQFRVSQSTVSNIFSRWIDVMYVCLEGFMQWPTSTILNSTMPRIFKEVFTTCDINVVIIDCFEVFIEQPSLFDAWALTWSRDKHNSTVKYLIGVTPQGSVCYLSMGWTGRTSDEYVIEQSGFLDKVQRGDVVVADRGFDITKSLGFIGAKLLVPSVITGMPGETDRRKLRRAELISHVQCVLKRVREKYMILNGIIPIDCVSTKPTAQLDQICRVCCMLTNLCPL